MAKARSNPAATHRLERARAPARPPVPVPRIRVEARLPSARRLIGRRRRQRKPGKPRPTAPPSWPAQANADGEDDEDSRRSPRSGETGSGDPATLRLRAAHSSATPRRASNRPPAIPGHAPRAQAHSTPRRDRTATSHRGQRRQPAPARLLTTPGKAHPQPPIIALDNRRYREQDGAACRKGPEAGG